MVYINVMPDHQLFYYLLFEEDESSEIQIKKDD